MPQADELLAGGDIAGARSKLIEEVRAEFLQIPEGNADHRNNTYPLAVDSSPTRNPLANAQGIDS